MRYSYEFKKKRVCAYLAGRPAEVPEGADRRNFSRQVRSRVLSFSAARHESFENRV